MDLKSIVWVRNKIPFKQSTINNQLSFLRKQESNYEKWIPHQVRNDKVVVKGLWKLK